MQDTERSQPPQAATAPDDVRNYQSSVVFGTIANALKSGWNHAATFAQQVRVQTPFAKTDTTARRVAGLFSNEAAGSGAGLGINLIGGAAQANRTVQMQTFDEAGAVTSGTLALQPFGGGMTFGGTSFPASPPTGCLFFRTDKLCWYCFDGAVWQIVGVEQTVAQDTTGIAQAITSTTFATITNSGATITTAGSGVLTVAAQVRANVVSGALLLRASIGGGTFTAAVMTVTTGDVTNAVVGRFTVAAGATTVKLEAAMAAAGSANILGAVAVWKAEKA